MPSFRASFRPSPWNSPAADTDSFSRSEPFRSQEANLRAFLARHADERVCVLELGVGQRNQAIRAPLMAWAESAPLASYVVLNREDPILPSLPSERVASACGDLGEALVALAEGAR